MPEELLGHGPALGLSLAQTNATGLKWTIGNVEWA